MNGSMLYCWLFVRHGGVTIFNGQTIVGTNNVPIWKDQRILLQSCSWCNDWTNVIHDTGGGTRGGRFGLVVNGRIWNGGGTGKIMTQAEGVPDFMN